MKMRWLLSTLSLLLLVTSCNTASADSKTLAWNYTNCTTPLTCDVATNFRLYKQISCLNAFNAVADIAVTTFTFVDNDVWPGMTYCYYITAMDSSGRESVHSNTLSFQMQTSPLPLAAPSNLRLQ
jgi:hypothetical protein